MPEQPPTLSVVVVTYNSEAEVRHGLPPLVPQLRDGDELIVVDNASNDATVDVVRELAPHARIVQTGMNAGYAGGCNAGAEIARGDVLLFLNPDAVAAPGFADAIRGPSRFDAWMGLVTQDGGTIVNTSGNVVHFTGLAWTGQTGEPVANVDPEPHEVAYLSGACLAIPRELWRRLGGYSPEFFLYHEDLDLSLRVRLAGGTLGIEPAARVDHAYEFAKGGYKWRWMERNRWATIVRLWPAPLIVLAAPALAATELAILAAAASGGWLPEKLGATRDATRSLPRLLRERRAIKRGKAISNADFARPLTADLSSPNLGGLVRAGAGPLGPARLLGRGPGGARILVRRLSRRRLEHLVGLGHRHQPELLHQSGDAPLEHAHPHREVQQHREDEDQPEEEQRRAGGDAADRVGDLDQEVVPGREHDERDRGEHPQQRVLLLQASPAHQLEHEEQRRRGRARSRRSACWW